VLLPLTRRSPCSCEDLKSVETWPKLGYATVAATPFHSCENNETFQLLPLSTELTFMICAASVPTEHTDTPDLTAFFNAPTGDVGTKTFRNRGQRATMDKKASRLVDALP
jgi:hypothetical protein